MYNKVFISINLSVSISYSELSEAPLLLNFV